MSLSLEMSGTKEAGLSPAEQAALERALPQVLVVVAPSDKFVAQLGQHLTEAARREAAAEQRRDRQLRTAGLVGGVVSVLGGLVVWLLWRRLHPKAPLAPAGARATELGA